MTSPLEQKIKITGPVVVTANRVGDGAVVYLRADRSWTTDCPPRRSRSDAASAREMVDAAIADDLRAVGSYIAPIKLTRDGARQPGNLREHIRLNGPTIDLPAIAAASSVVRGENSAPLTAQRIGMIRAPCMSMTT